MNILFLADPNSIHDLKWVSYFSIRENALCFILPRTAHHNMLTRNSGHVRLQEQFRFTLLDPISDFSIVRFYETFRTAYRIRSIVRKKKIDIVHVLYAEPNALWCIFRGFINVPMIISCRGTDILKTIPEVYRKKTWINKIVGPAYRSAFRNADWVTGTSYQQIKSLQRYLDRTDRISVVRTGVELSRFNPTQENSWPENVGSKKKYILFPRYIRPLYNHEFSLDAIALLPDNVKREYSFVFLGRNNGDLRYQSMLEDKMGKIDGVEFVFLPKQDTDTLIQLYRNASLVVMNPLSDGSPVSAMEALLCKTKVILGPIDYDEEIFSGVVDKLNRWDTRELADLMVASLSDPATPAALSEKRKQLMNRDYNMAQMMSIYRNVTKNFGG